MKSTVSRIFILLFLILFMLPITLVRCRPPWVDKRPESGVLVKVYLVGQKRTLSLDLEEYLKGVVAAEMPANFHLEALKAQAVAARTVTLKRLVMYGGKGCRWDRAADFSDDPAEVQAWLDEGQLRKRWGRNYNRNWRRICHAVDATRGIILTYQGQPIDAVFHSTSGPRTENAADVWGRDFPYLRSVACPYDKHSPRYRQTVTITIQEFGRQMGVRLSRGALTRAVPATSSLDGISVTERSASGRVKYIRVGDKTFRGEDLRRRLGLRSTHLTIKDKAGYVEIETIGYGHGVGLCQYGADGMATKGYRFRGILKHYYSGVEIRKLVSKGK
jgi:stage II sporulation protein D